MPLLNFFATPSLAPVRFQLLCREYEVIHYYTQQGSDKVLRVDGTRGRLVAPLYLYSRHALTRPSIVATIRKLIATENLVVFVCDMHLQVGGVPIQTTNISTGRVLFDLLHSSIGNDLPADFLMGDGRTIEATNTAISQDVAKESMGNSVMNKVQTMMYRVPTADRDAVRTEIFNYLAGKAPQFGTAGQYPPVISLINNPDIARLRVASLYAKEHGIDAAVAEHRVDAFDLRYLAATTSGKPKSRRPRIEDSKGVKEHKRRMSKDGEREQRYRKKL